MSVRFMGVLLTNCMRRMLLARGGQSIGGGADPDCGLLRAPGDQQQRHCGAGDAGGGDHECEDPRGNDHARDIGRRRSRLHPRMSVLDPLTDEQRDIRDLVRTLARERIAPRAAEIDKSAEFPWDVVELFRENEIFGILFDEEYGGIGASALMTLVAIEEVSKVCATSGLIIAAQELGSLGLKLAGSEEQKQRYLPK